MSKLNPRGIPFEINGQEYRFLFTLSVVDEVQELYDAPVSSVIAKMADDREVYDVIANITAIMINDELKRTGSAEKEISVRDVKWMIDVPMADKLVKVIMQSYGYSLPDPDEDEDPN